MTVDGGARMPPSLLARVADLAHAAYVWGLAVVAGIPTWLLVLTLPELRWRWAVFRLAGRFLARSAGVEMTVSGTVPDAPGLVIVANHQSYIDGLAIIASSRAPVSFLAGGDLERQRIAGPFLTKLGCEFVRRGDPEMRERLARRLAGGGRLVVFPEGSLARAPGVRPFRLGAFFAAAKTGAPVLPVGTDGSREVVRPGSKFPRRGIVRVAAGEPTPPRAWSGPPSRRWQDGHAPRSPH